MQTSTRNQALSLETIEKLAPSVFATRAWSGVSERYSFIPTVSVVESLMSEGWNVMKVQQQTTRLPDKKDFTRHILRFRRPSENVLAVGDVFPEIVLINSHDRGSAYQMHAGLFRLVCLNGLVVDDSTFSRLSIRHSGNVIDEVRRGVDSIVKEIPRITGEVNIMQDIELTPDERGVFARAALSLKYDETIPIEPTRMLSRKRYGDEKQDLWTTFNVIQENLIRGKVPYTVPSHRDEEGVYHYTQRKHTRAVNSIQEDTKLNKALWTLAEEMKKLKMN